MKRLHEFWNAYSRQIVRFWTNQIVMSVLGISIGLATIALKIPAVSIIGCVFSIGLLCFLQYDNLFQLGEKHHYRPADAARPAKTLGLKVTLLGSCPLILFILFGMLVTLILSDEAEVICKLIYYALHGSYLQLHTYFPKNHLMGWLVCLLFTLPAIFSGTLGYLLGSLDRPIHMIFSGKKGKSPAGK